MKTLEILERLVAFDTVSARTNLPLIDYVEDFLASRGFEITRIPDETGLKAGLFCSAGPRGSGGAEGILLAAHSDVVPAEGQVWSRDPFRLTREGDRLYGRGTTDMKGYLAAMLSAADRLSDRPLREPLHLAISYDEEIGCVGMNKMIGGLVPAIGLPRACFVGEPTEMQLAIGQKGKGAMRAVCHGQSGHSALAPLFVSALHLATDFVTELQGVQEDLRLNGARDDAYGVPYSTVHSGVLNSGTALNIVPDRADLVFEYRHLAADRPQDIRNLIERAAERVCGKHRPRFAETRIDLELYNAYPGLDVSEGAEVVTLGKSLAQSNSVTKVAFGTEAGFFDGLGIPTVICGPGSMEGQGHKPDEFVTLAQLAACDAMMDRILDELSA